MSPIPRLLGTGDDPTRKALKGAFRISYDKFDGFDRQGRSFVV